MFAPSVLLVFVLAFVLGTSAVPTLSARDNSTCSSTGAQCNTGTVSCCQTTYASDSKSLSRITSALNIALDPAEGSVGMGCSPISVIGTGSGALVTHTSIFYRIWAPLQCAFVHCKSVNGIIGSLTVQTPSRNLDWYRVDVRLKTVFWITRTLAGRVRAQVDLSILTLTGRALWDLELCIVE
ncbi:hypothetical protein EDB19DRAFT_1946103 [Suillus lakei]|nr:hypothetical protein EDB19DRAFT_1946103 [Suillus lakei]